MPGGRPSKFSPDVQERILKAIAVGAPLELAARAAGVSYSSLRRWLMKGERSRKGDLRAFFVAMQDAQSKALNRWLAVIDQAAANGDWRAAAWKAEHAHPEFFGKNRVEVTGKNGGPVEQRIEPPPANRQITDPAQQAEILKILKDCGALEHVLGVQPDAAAPAATEAPVAAEGGDDAPQDG